MLVSVYIRISNHLIQRYPHQMDPQNKHLAPFAARLLARQTGLVSTVETLPAQIHQRRLAGQIILAHDQPAGLWNLHAPGAEGGAPDSDNLIFSSPRLVRVAAWLVHNQLCQPDRICLLEPEGVELPENFNFYQFLGDLNQAFPIFDPGRDNLDIRWSAGGHSPIFIVLNFQGPDQEDLKEIDFILTTGWGEMRHFYLPLEDLPNNPDRYLKIARTLIKEAEARPENLLFHNQEASPKTRKAALNIRGSVIATLRRNPPPEAGPKRLIDI
jgi:hypothetical protein